MAIRRRALQIFTGEVIVTALTALATVAFIGEGSILTVARNVVIVDAVFIVVYLVWIRVFAHYEKLYKQGLKEGQRRSL